MDVGASFGAWLKRRRKQLDLTQEALAEKVGCSVATIQKIESDERRPSRQIAELLAQHLEIPPAERATFLKVARGELRVTRLAEAVPPGFPAPAAVSIPSTSASPPVSNLPFPPTPLVGRETELAALARLLSDPQCRLLTLVGPGGIGKTRLAIAAATASAALCRDGVCWIPLALLSAPEFIMSALGTALYREINDEAGLSNGLDHLGDIAWRTRDFDTARAAYAESLMLRRQLGDPVDIGMSLYSAGRLCVDYGYL